MKNRVKSPRRHNNHKCICTKHQIFKVHEAKTKQTVRRNEEIHNFSQTSPLFPQQLTELVNKKIIKNIELMYN